MSDADRDGVLAEVLPWLRGQVSQQTRFIGTVEHRASVTNFVNSADAARLAELGTSCPDHFLRTKIKPLYVDWDPKSGDVGKLRSLLSDGLSAYRADYAKYYNEHKYDDSPAMRDPNPTVILIPGVGMVAWGKNKSESRVTAEFYSCAVEVMKGAESVSEYQGIGFREAFDIEYWALEEAKLKRQPPEKPLARQVCVVVGGGSGIGRETCGRLLKEGAEVVAVDLKADAAEETARELEEMVGKGIGVAGSGISGCGDAVGLEADITDRASLKAMYDQCPARLRRRRPRHRHRRLLRHARQERRQQPRAVGRELPHQRHRHVQRRRGRASHPVRAGSGRHGRADDERERGRPEEGQLRLRHEQGRRQPPREGAGCRLRPERPRERRGPGDRRGRQQHVPPRPGASAA